MPFWWKRLKPNRSTLPAAFIATLLCSVCLLVIWTPRPAIETEMSRYGEALAQTLAHSNASLLLHRKRIELAVIANQVVRHREVAGVIFYTPGNEIIALSGSTDAGPHFTAPAALDDTITGYAFVVLARESFTPPFRIWSWLLSLLIIAATPFISLGVLQLSARGNRSLPIVSVPEPTDTRPQQSFCLTINLYNQIALGRAQRDTAVGDAMNMAREVCAIHQGIAVDVPERGIVMLFDRNAVNAGNALCASFLMERLLEEFETDGRFRCHLSETECPGSPADLSTLSLDELERSTDVEELMTLAALAKPQTVLLSEAVYAALTDDEKTWARVFSHPLLEDIDDAAYTYLVDRLPAEQGELVDNQAMLILGFNQASA